MEDDLEILARQVLLVIAVCYPAYFDQYKAELASLGAQGEIVERFVDAFVRWFGDEGNLDDLLIRSPTP
jgi:hypothetical protein